MARRAGPLVSRAVVRREVNAQLARVAREDIEDRLGLPVTIMTDAMETP
jgi:hypothetical protein